MLNRIVAVLKSWLSRYFYYILIAGVVLGPGIGWGYLFLLDMPWPADFSIEALTARDPYPHLPLMFLVWALNSFVPAWLLQKLVLGSILFAVGVGAHKLVYYKHKSGSSLAPYLAGTLAVLNPFVAERLLAGQWLVLAGYAYLFYICLALLKLADKPNKANTIKLGLLAVIMPMVSLHFTLLAIPLLAAIWLIKLPKIKLGMQLSVATLIISFGSLLNSYWLVGFNSAGGKLAGIQMSDYAVFATLPDNDLGYVANVLSLYGFWANANFLPKDYFFGWFVYGLVVWVFAGLALILGVKRNQRFSIAVAIVLPLYFTLALGYNTRSGRLLIEALDNVGGFRGLRDTAKAVGVLALVVAVFAPLGIEAFMSKIKYLKHLKLAYITALMLVLVSMNGMLFGARGQLKAYDYPDGWYQVAAELKSDKYQKTIALPWQGYLNLDYADNKRVANPAVQFFGHKIVASELTGNRQLDDLNPVDSFMLSYRQENLEGWLEGARIAGFDSVILVKQGSWGNYSSLLTNPDINRTYQVVIDTPSAALIDMYP